MTNHRAGGAGPFHAILALAAAFVLGGVAVGCQSEPDRSVRVDGQSASGTAVESRDAEASRGGSHQKETSTEGASAEGTSAEGASADGASAEGTPTEGASIRDNSAEGTSADRNSAEGTSAAGTSAEGTSADRNSAEGTSAAGTSTEGTSADRTSGEGTSTQSASTEQSSRPADDHAVSGLRTEPLPTSRFVELGKVAPAEPGKEVGTSRFSDVPGYEAPDDPERDAVLQGRREAPRVEGDLEGAVRGFDALVDGLMKGLDDTDPRALTYLRISGHDYEKFCWPEFPHSRPITNIPVNESWLFLERRCHGGISHGLSEWGDQALRPVRVEFRDGRADYRNFTMWKGMVIYATRPGSEEEVAIDFAEVAIERNGLWKVYAFKD